jgi:hypothetical protein
VYIIAEPDWWLTHL